MGSVDENPWNESGIEIPPNISRVLEKLKQEGDEIETREAWLEKLADIATCPVCDSVIELVNEGEIPQLKCEKESKHLSWPA